MSETAVDILEVGVGKIRIQSGSLFPADAGVIAPAGSKYLCTIDGTWHEALITVRT